MEEWCGIQGMSVFQRSIPRRKKGEFLRELFFIDVVITLCLSVFFVACIEIRDGSIEFGRVMDDERCPSVRVSVYRLFVVVIARSRTQIAKARDRSLTVRQELVQIFIRSYRTTYCPPKNEETEGISKERKSRQLLRSAPLQNHIDQSTSKYRSP